LARKLKILEVFVDKTIHGSTLRGGDLLTNWLRSWHVKEEESEKERDTHIR
jgi:hypothetical protein